MGRPQTTVTTIANATAAAAARGTVEQEAACRHYRCCDVAVAAKQLTVEGKSTADVAVKRHALDLGHELIGVEVQEGRRSFLRTGRADWGGKG